MSDLLTAPLDALLKCYPALSVCSTAIYQAFLMMRTSFLNGGKLLLCGNGGSAADADHFSAELLKQFQVDRPFTLDQQRALGPALASKLQAGLPAIPLPCFTALTSAFCNDCDPAYVFAQLTAVLGKPGDTLFCLSTSGNANNVFLAAQTAKALGLSVIGLTGRTGGRLASVVDCCICVPEDRVAAIQELHLPVYHTLCLLLETDFFGNR